MGRKPLDQNAKIGIFQIRVTDSERHELKSAAALIGVAASKWLRDLGLAEARRIQAASLNEAVPAKKKASKPKPS
jgi:hypothetical protein